MEEEIWKDIVGYDGRWKVSNLGRVKSLMGPRGEKREKILKHGISKGYCHVGLYKDRKMKNFFVHRLVAIAFIPNPENKPHVNHKKGDKLDNRACMLEWATCSENNKEAYRIGLKIGQKGEIHGSSILSEPQVLEIRDRAGTLTQKDMALQYGVSRATICHIINKKTWTHI
jgi:hypothetical protein